MLFYVSYSALDVSQFLDDAFAAEFRTNFKNFAAFIGSEQVGRVGGLVVQSHDTVLTRFLSTSVEVRHAMRVFRWSSECLLAEGMAVHSIFAN